MQNPARANVFGSAYVPSPVSTPIILLNTTLDAIGTSAVNLPTDTTLDGTQLIGQIGGKAQIVNPVFEGGVLFKHSVTNMAMIDGVSTESTEDVVVSIINTDGQIPASLVLVNRSQGTMLPDALDTKAPTLNPSFEGIVALPASSAVTVDGVALNTLLTTVERKVLYDDYVGKVSNDGQPLASISAVTILFVNEPDAAYQVFLQVTDADKPYFGEVTSKLASRFTFRIRSYANPLVDGDMLNSGARVDIAIMREGRLLDSFYWKYADGGLVGTLPD